MPPARGCRLVSAWPALSHSSRLARGSRCAPKPPSSLPYRLGTSPESPVVPTAIDTHRRRCRPRMSRTSKFACFIVESHLSSLWHLTTTFPDALVVVFELKVLLNGRPSSTTLASTGEVGERCSVHFPAEFPTPFASSHFALALHESCLNLKGPQPAPWLPELRDTSNRPLEVGKMSRTSYRVESYMIPLLDMSPCSIEDVPCLSDQFEPAFRAMNVHC